MYTGFLSEYIYKKMSHVRCVKAKQAGGVEVEDEVKF